MISAPAPVLSAVPPSISDTQSSSDVIVRENANVSLSCAASGSPDPVVRWKRDDNSTINVNKTLAGESNQQFPLPKLWTHFKIKSIADVNEV